MLGSKTVEFWAVIIGMSVYIATRDAETESVSKRASKVVASGFLAIGLSPVMSDYFGIGETASAVVIMAFGLIILDLLTALVKDREFMKELIKKKLGGDSND